MIARSSNGWLADGPVEYLDLADYLLIAEAVLGIPAETIALWPGIGLADSALHAPRAGFEGAELYPM